MLLHLPQFMTMDQLKALLEKWLAKLAVEIEPETVHAKMVTGWDGEFEAYLENLAWTMRYIFKGGDRETRRYLSYVDEWGDGEGIVDGKRYSISEAISVAVQSRLFPISDLSIPRYSRPASLPRIFGDSPKAASSRPIAKWVEDLCPQTLDAPVRRSLQRSRSVS